ncbi:hypothetical protein C6560_09920 [Enterobacter sp. FS01]|nr:hypothetical protein C6560_09920 [Enterobacter sp. FS01]
MARRIELQGIVNALNGSFVSRNNDFRGYWSIGQLKSFAINNDLTSIKLSLTAFKNSDVFNLQNHIVHQYTGMLQNLLRKQAIPLIWVNEASITIDFYNNAEYTSLHEGSDLGEPFKCRCQIIDDTGHDYSSIIFGLCQPHSIMNELKSTRKSTM